MEENKIIKVKDKWAEKYVKDSVWFPFGSLLNAWAAIKKDTPISLDEFLKDTDKIFDKAVDSTIQAYKIYKKIEVDDSSATNFQMPLKSKKK